jgi:aminoglycoside phosphotransferase (APT) family kinase protein
VSRRLRRWLADKFGGDVSDAEPPSAVSGGFDFWIYSLRYAGSQLPQEWRAPLIARVPPDPERFAAVERETELQAWTVEHGYPAPAVLALLEPGEVLDSPLQAVHRAPGVTMMTAMTNKPWRIPGLVDGLADLQVRLHGLAVPEWATGPEWSIAEKRLSLVRHVVDELQHVALRAALAEIELRLPDLQVADPVICHGDFHPMNLLISDDESTVIDWTDAGVGDRHCDIARTSWLFHFAAAAAPSRAERSVVKATAPFLSRRHLAAYGRRHPIDRRRLSMWLPLHVLHMWATLIADQHELAGPSRAGTDFRPGLLEWARQEFQRSIHS